MNNEKNNFINICCSDLFDCIFTKSDPKTKLAVKNG